MEKYAGLLELIKLSPSVKLLDVTSHADEFSELLARHLIEAGGHLDLALYPGEHIVPEYDFVKSSSPKDYKSPFRALPRDYATVFIRDVLDKHMFAERILKIAYTTLLNASEIVVIQDKATMSQEAVEELLEKLDYRAINSIDMLDDAYVVVGKKMHMWGNGL